VKATEFRLLPDRSSKSEIGASGFVHISAPFPSSEALESPYLLIAITFAKILEPQLSLNGAELSIAVGILH
jgi:hypothetical protein